MLHPDHETRIGAHKIFSVVLVPSSVSPCADSAFSDTKNMCLPRSLSRTVSVFSSSAALFEKLKNQKKNSVENINELNNETVSPDTGGLLQKIRSSYSRAHSFRSLASPDTDSLNKPDRDKVGFGNVFFTLLHHGI